MHVLTKALGARDHHKHSSVLLGYTQLVWTDEKANKKATAPATNTAKRVRSTSSRRPRPRDGGPSVLSFSPCQQRPTHGVGSPRWGPLLGGVRTHDVLLRYLFHD
jgi:hypothetical protein